MTIRTFAEAERVLARSLPGYAPRPQQQRLAAAVEDLFDGDTPAQLLAQAGCGVGKSLGGLIPAILAEKPDGKSKRIIVATATKALQEQYVGRDVPFLQEHLGVPFTWALLKGRSNYVCAAKLSDVNTLQFPQVEALREELSDFEGHSGDFEHLETNVPEESRSLLSMSGGECPGRTECPFAEQCFAEKAKAQARGADLVVTNTAMLMTELRIRQLSGGGTLMLGDYDAVIIDEAHELPEIAASSLADQFRRRGLEVLLTRASNFVAEHDGQDATELLGGLRENVDAIWTHLEELGQGGQIELRAGELEANIEPYISLVKGLKALEEVVAGTQIRTGERLSESTRQRRLVKLIIDTVSRLIEFVTTEGVVRWVETETVGRGRNARTVTTLKYSPVEVGPFLHEHLWSATAVALVSATLGEGGDFSYITSTLGLTDPATLDVGTPFDYSTQARLFIPDARQPDPSRDRSAWLSYAQTTTRQLIEAAGGGALLLYTSRSAMQSAYAMLGPILEASGYTCLMQGEHGTNKELAARFTEDTHSVLFALKSFFTGVDFAGDTCRLVVIDKMPFPVPSDIMFNARAQLMNRRASRDVSFERLSVPMMTLTLVQGAGRLIRSVNDRGVIAILDPRLSSKGYGRRIVRSLPPAPVTDKIADVAGFYAA